MFEAGIELSKVEKFLENKLRSGGLQKKLTIIDPYFFSTGNFGKVQNLMNNVLTPFRSTLEILEVVTSTFYSKDCSRKLASQLKPVSIRIFSEDKFHDRFWIIDEKKAFVVGASVNGFGGRHFFIQDDFLSAKDTQTILGMYKSAS